MRAIYLTLLSVIIENIVYADQLDGLAIFDFLIYVLLVGVISLLALIISTVLRFSRKNYKVSIPLNFSASVLSVCAMISSVNLGSTIDPGFLAVCIGVTVISITLMILNYRVSIKEVNKGDEN